MQNKEKKEKINRRRILESNVQKILQINTTSHKRGVLIKI